MFDVGWTEVLVIAVVMVIVVGPKDLPAMLRTMGRYVGKLKRTASEFRSQFEDAIRETELEEVRNQIESLRNIDSTASVKKAVRDSHEPDRKPVGKVDRKPSGAAVKAKPKATAKKSTSEKTSTRAKTPRARKPRATAGRKGKTAATRSRA